MASVEIRFYNNDEEEDFVDFDVSSALENEIDEYVNQTEFDDWEIVSWDDDYPDPNEFASLSEYAEIVDKIDEHGEAYRLRYDDIGDFDFGDEYNGCWDSEEDFARDLFEQCYDIPDNLYNYIDWESVARDVMMDYSSYDGSEGIHIFRD